jgi:tetratricopeptide (TPR) repeat protein
MPADRSFGDRLRELIAARGESYRRLGARTHYGKSYLHDLATGRKAPTLDTAARLDDALDAGGSLVATLPAGARLDGADEQTEALAAWLGDGAPVGERLTEVGQHTEQLALDYLAQGVTLVGRAQALRADTRALLHQARTPDQLRDAVLAIGYQSGVLAYLALDAGAEQSAAAHADLAWRAADRAGSDQLRAWVRGTQSLITRFAGDFRAAMALAEDGLRHASTGTAAARLWCGIAQCHANMADAPAARRALNRAADALESARGVDEMPGLFGFSPAKLAYYSGSSLIWLPGKADNRRARAQAREAITLWQASGPEDRSLADEALAHVYAATASLAVGDLEAAVADLEPILGLPPRRRISWIVKRLDRVSGMLAGPPYAGGALAAETLERIAAY